MATTYKYTQTLTITNNNSVSTTANITLKYYASASSSTVLKTINDTKTISANSSGTYSTSWTSTDYIGYGVATVYFEATGDYSQSSTTTQGMNATEG